MLRELLGILRGDNPLRAMGDNFAQMLSEANQLTKDAGEMFFGEPVTPEERTQIYQRDVQINKLQRRVRKQVISHLSIRSNTSDLPYCLALLSLVKDVERIGDYAKNLAEVREIHPAQLPEDDILAELREIRTGVERAFAVAAEVFAASDRERALELLQHGQELRHRSDVLIERIAAGTHDARTTTAFILGTRYYKRIGAHVLNVLSSVVMPLHKLDYYDEDELEAEKSPPGT